MSSARFITLEGTEGVGKSTNLQHMCDVLETHGIPWICTREPGGTPLAEELRALILRKREERVDPMAELLTIFAARAQHLNTVIRPALAGGTWVICDRFTDATYAYQGGGRGMDRRVIETLESLVQGTLRPDAVLLLDLDPEVGLARARRRGEADRFEAETLAFFQRVREAYREREEASPYRYHRIDASRTVNEVGADVRAVMERYIRECGA